MEQNVQDSPNPFKSVLGGKEVKEKKSCLLLNVLVWEHVMRGILVNSLYVAHLILLSIYWEQALRGAPLFLVARGSTRMLMGTNVQCLSVWSQHLTHKESICFAPCLSIIWRKRNNKEIERDLFNEEARYQCYTDTFIYLKNGVSCPTRHFTWILHFKLKTWLFSTK